MYSLRALTLAEGAALLIKHRQYAPAYPVLRSLFEVWAAVTYAHVRFRALVVRGNKWAKFDQIASRLILGTTSQPDTPEVIEIGHMLDEARSHMIEYLVEDESGDTDPETVRDVLDQAYSTLSDGTHPTQFALLAHVKIREDKLGVKWQLDAIDETGQVRLSLLDDLRFALRLLREFVPLLSATGDEIESAARSGPMQDPQVREATIQALKRLLEGGQMPPSSTKRITQMLEYLEQGGGVETP